MNLESILILTDGDKPILIEDTKKKLVNTSLYTEIASSLFTIYYNSAKIL